MTRALITLISPDVRARAADWCRRLPLGTRVEFKKPRRSLDQNSKMWASLTDIAMQLPWHGQKLAPDDWKLIFLDALKRELRLAPNIDGTGFVNLGRSSSDLSKEEMSELLELIIAFGANHNVIFHDSVSLAPSFDGAAKPEAEDAPASTSGNSLVPA
jgi:hypothetical protein